MKYTDCHSKLQKLQKNTRIDTKAIISNLIKRLIMSLTSKTHLELSRVHLIGHNLGAHAASYTGHRLYGLGRITGLDPSTIYFEGKIELKFFLIDWQDRIQINS